MRAIASSMDRADFSRFPFQSYDPRLSTFQAAKSSKHLDKGNFDRNNVIFHLSPSMSLNLLKMQSRDYYWLLNRGDTKATGLIKWEKELQLVDFKWENYFNSIKTFCNETKLRDFYYKLLHRIVATKRELFFYGIASNQTCYLCGMPDSIKHTFVDCPISNQLYNKIIIWFNEDNASSFYPSSLEILFGNFECSRANGLKVRKLNYTLLFSKYYIYCQKLNNKELNFNEFKQRCLFHYKVEGLNE